MVGIKSYLSTQNSTKVRKLYTPVILHYVHCLYTSSVEINQINIKNIYLPQNVIIISYENCVCGPIPIMGIILSKLSTNVKEV